MTRSFAQQLDRDAAVFLAGPTNGFGTKVVNGGAIAYGLVDERYVDVDDGGVLVQRKVKMLRLKTGEGGTIDIGTTLSINGTLHRVDRIIPVTPDRLFTDYVIAGGTA